MGKERLTAIVALVVVAMWALSIVSGILTGDYEALQIVTPIMAAVAGYLFTRDFFRRSNSDS